MLELIVKHSVGDECGTAMIKRVS